MIKLLKACALIGLLLTLTHSLKAESAELSQYSLHRIVEWRLASEPDSEFRTQKKYTSQLGDHIYGVWHTWAYYPHQAQGLWLTKFKAEEKSITFDLKLDTQEFPLGGDWTTLQHIPHYRLVVGKTVQFTTKIKDKVFRATLLLLKSK